MSPAQGSGPGNRGSNEGRGEGPLSSQQEDSIDVHLLAEKVYRLLLRDLRLNRARGVPAIDLRKR